MISPKKGIEENYFSEGEPATLFSNINFKVTIGSRSGIHMP